jgi:hypothetical protein
MNVDVRYLLITMLLIVAAVSSAQEWVARYNGPTDGHDYASAIAVDNEGNVWVTGTSMGLATSYDYTTVKYDSAGTEICVIRYNGPGNGEDHARAIALDNAGNVYVTGRSFGLGTNYDYATVKYNSSGVEQWVARYDAPGFSPDEARAITLDDKGNVYVTGMQWGVYGDYATVVYDSSGVEQWVATYNGAGNDWDYAEAIAVDEECNVYVTGTTQGSGDYATIKYDSSGIEQWVALYNGPDNGGDFAEAIVVGSNGAVYVTGQSISAATSYDYATVKYNSLGVEQWVMRYDGPGNGNDGAHAITVDNSGNIYVTGCSHRGGIAYDMATLKYDTSGMEQWVVRFPDTGGVFAGARAMSIDHMGNVVVTGYAERPQSGRDYATVKYNTLGIEQWVTFYSGPDCQSDGALAIAVDSVGCVYITGVSFGLGTGRDYATIKYAPTSIEENKTIARQGNEIIATIFRGSLQLPEGNECKIFDITGRVMEPDQIQPGIYFIEIDGVVTQKVVKVR